MCISFSVWPAMWKKMKNISVRWNVMNSVSVRCVSEQSIIKVAIAGIFRRRGLVCITRGELLRLPRFRTDSSQTSKLEINTTGRQKMEKRCLSSTLLTRSASCCCSRNTLLWSLAGIVCSEEFRCALIRLYESR